MIPYTLNENSISFFFAGRPRSVASDHPNYDGIIAAVINNRIDDLNTFLDTKKFVTLWTRGKVTIDSDDRVRFKGTPVNEYLAQRIIAHYKTDPRLVEPLVAFTEKLMENPNHEIREDLFKWLENGKMPIYPDGDFAAYKVVRSDFTPVHKGPYGQDQSPGSIVEMPRTECDEDRNNTCSRGLHFCSYDYLKYFDVTDPQNVVILLKINPRDVTAIPTDYNLTKGRCCRFEVLEKISYETILEDFGNKLVITGKSTSVNSASDDAREDDNASVADRTDVVDFATYQEVKQLLEVFNGNKSAVAQRLGISRSTVYRLINKFGKEEQPQELSNREKALQAIEAANGNKTQAAKALGIPRSTLYKWLG